MGIRRSIQPVKSWEMRCQNDYLFAVGCKWFAYGPADATATPSSLASLTFLVPDYPGCPGREAIKWVSIYRVVQKGHWPLLAKEMPDISHGCVATHLSIGKVMGKTYSDTFLSHCGQGPRFLHNPRCQMCKDEICTKYCTNLSNVQCSLSALTLSLESARLTQSPIYHKRA